MRLLPWKQPNLIMKLAADYYRMPAAGGTTLRLRRYTKLVPPVVPIGNTGVTPPSQNLTAVDIDAQMSFYATYVDINEQVTLQSQDRPLNEAVKLLGQAMREAEDQLTRDVLVATAGFINCVDGVNGDNPTEITRSDVNTVVQTLLSNDAYTIMDVVEAQDKFGTAPTRPAYLVLCHSNMSSSLENVDGFINTANYPSQANVNSSEYGNVGYGRFFISSKGSVIPNASANGNDVYNNIFIGLHSYGCIEQDQYSAQFIYRPPIFSGPVALNSTAAVKFAEVSRVLNDSWIVLLRSTIA